MYLNLSRILEICSVEFGSKVFAIFNLILTVSSMGTICAYIYCEARDILDFNSHSEKSFGDFFGSSMAHFFITVKTVALVLSIVAFIFALVLVYGVYKKKCTQLHVYCVYGLAVETWSLLAIGYFFLTGEGDTNVLIAMLTACFIYGFILFMIKKTYDKFKTLNQQSNPEPLLIEKF